MKIKGVVFEDFVNYKKPSMYLIFPNCSFKCDKECGRHVCQNSTLASEPVIEIDKDELIENYLSNPITESVVMAGLEPFDSQLDLLPFVDALRRQYHCNNDVVIYTGYTEQELQEGNWGNGSKENQRQYWLSLISYGNIIIKYGRFRPDEPSHYDEVLGVNLASSNQYAKKYPLNIKTIQNPDKELVELIKEKIKSNDGYCPCALTKEEDTKCMCKDFRDKINSKVLGECHCGLYINVKGESNE
jgi:ferredoxin-thioredoxin reductase catalytic subunit